MKNLKKIFLFLFVAILFIACGDGKKKDHSIPDVEPDTITFASKDGLTITADLYKIADENAPYIILFHQAFSSRGEYKTIAPRLNSLGFNCLAVDQRSGLYCKGIKNQTAAKARKLHFGRKYIHALPDLRASLFYVKDELKARKIIVWGSSYSSSLLFVLANEYPEDINGLLAFSPGEYFKDNDKKIMEYAASVKCPVFVTAEKKVKEQAKGIYDKVPSGNKVFLDVKKHGSRLLWDSKNAAWEEAVTYLKSI